MKFAGCHHELQSGWPAYRKDRNFLGIKTWWTQPRGWGGDSRLHRAAVFDNHLFIWVGHWQFHWTWYSQVRLGV